MTYTFCRKKPSYHTFAPDIVIFYHYIFQLVSSGGTKQQIFHVVGYILQQASMAASIPCPFGHRTNTDGGTEGAPLLP